MDYVVRVCFYLFGKIGFKWNKMVVLEYLFID